MLRILKTDETWVEWNLGEQKPTIPGDEIIYMRTNGPESEWAVQMYPSLCPLTGSDVFHFYGDFARTIWFNL